MGMSLKFFISSILTSICRFRSLEALCIRFFILISTIRPWVAFSNSSFFNFMAASLCLYFFFFYSCWRSNSLCCISMLCLLNLSREALSTSFSLSTLACFSKPRLILFYTIFTNDAGFFKVFVNKSLCSSDSSVFCRSRWLTRGVLLVGELTDLAVNPT